MQFLLTGGDAIGGIFLFIVFLVILGSTIKVMKEYERSMKLLRETVQRSFGLGPSPIEGFRQPLLPYSHFSRDQKLKDSPQCLAQIFPRDTPSWKMALS